MKTRISQLVAALFFAIVVIGNVNANEHKLEASSHENNQETVLEFENWMTDAEVWDTHADGMYAEIQESNLEVENWMTSELVWDVEFEILDIENWMLSESTWEVAVEMDFTLENETELTVENWMLSENIW